MRKLALVAFALAVAGVAVYFIITWQPRMYRVTGTVTRDGKPLEWKGDKNTLLVIFAPMPRKTGTPIYRAEFSDPKTGAYTLLPIPSGEYRVSIEQQEGYPPRDMLDHAYNLKSSPIVKTVSGDCTINIDLPRDLPR